MALADQIAEATPEPSALLLSNEARGPPALTGTKIVTVDANGSSDGTVTLVVGQKMTRPQNGARTPCGTSAVFPQSLPGDGRLEVRDPRGRGAKTRTWGEVSATRLRFLSSECLQFVKSARKHYSRAPVVARELRIQRSSQRIRRPEW